MKSIKLIFPLLILAASCGSNSDDKKTDAADSSATETTATVPEKVFPQTYYVGDFVASVYKEKLTYTSVNKITVSIDSLGRGFIKGYSVVAGNERPFTGSFTENANGKYECKVSEPGDDKYDGVFNFTLMPDSGVIQGTWKANDAKLAVTERTFLLRKKEFKYDPTLAISETIADEQLTGGKYEADFGPEKISKDVAKYNGSSVELKVSQVENMYKGDMEIIRNAIYARHGYSFKSKRMRFIFDKFVDWYMPVNTDVRNELTKLEQKNIELLQRYEKHASSYYDDYGR
ncbi:MAG: YARHG domain-containing protein [Bacteroidia bacterium]|nr:YARHG domain-containing protein [Bacteroidia bacterium]